MALPYTRYKSVVELVDAKATEKLGPAAGKLMLQVFAATLESMAVQSADGPLAELLEDTKVFYYEREVWQKLFPGEKFVGEHPDAEALHQALAASDPRNGALQDNYDELTIKYDQLMNKHEELWQNYEAAKRVVAELRSCGSFQISGCSSQDDRQSQAGGRIDKHERDCTSTSRLESGNQSPDLRQQSTLEFGNMLDHPKQSPRRSDDHGRQNPQFQSYWSARIASLVQPKAVPGALARDEFRKTYQSLIYNSGLWKGEPTLGWCEGELEGSTILLPQYWIHLKTTNAWRSFLGSRGNNIREVNKMLPRCLTLRGDRLCGRRSAVEELLKPDLVIIWIEPVSSASPKDPNVMAAVEEGYRILKAWANERLSPPSNPSAGPSIVDFWRRHRGGGRHRPSASDFRQAQPLAHSNSTEVHIERNNGGRMANNELLLLD